MDWWFYLGFPVHLPANVDLQARVRRERTIHRPPQVLLRYASVYGRTYTIAVLTITSNCKVEMHVLRACCCPASQEQDYVTTSFRCYHEQIVD